MLKPTYWALRGAAVKVAKNAQNAKKADFDFLAKKMVFEITPACSPNNKG